MKRTKINTVNRLSGAVQGSLGVCAGLGGAEAGLCALWLWRLSYPGSRGPWFHAMVGLGQYEI